MRVSLLSLALAVSLGAPVAAEPVLPFAPFLLPHGQARVVQERPVATPRRNGGDSRDIVFGSDFSADREVRPARRPEGIAEPLREASIARRISRMPWSTGVFQ